jgi:hypothetical protein
LSCWQAVSTNNAYVRTHDTSRRAGGGPKLFSFLIRSMEPHENARYQFLWK